MTRNGLILRSSEQGMLSCAPCVRSDDRCRREMELVAARGQRRGLPLNARGYLSIRRGAQQGFLLRCPRAVFWVWLRFAKKHAASLNRAPAAVEKRSHFGIRHGAQQRIFFRRPNPCPAVNAKFLAGTRNRRP